MTNLETIIESRAERDQLVEHVDVLDKVKALSLLPDDVHVTVEMAASYYEVPSDAIEWHLRNSTARAELEADGLHVLSGERLSAFKAESGYRSRAGSLTLLPRRALLRIGMQLRDSAVARQVRDRLLDIEREQNRTEAAVVDFSSTEGAISTLTAMLEFLQQQRRVELAAEGAQRELEAARPKAAYVDQFVAAGSDATLVRVVAQQLGYGEHQLRNWLAERKVIYRRPAGQRYSESQRGWVDEYEWTPYSGYRSWFVVRDQPEAPRLHNGQLRTTMYVSPLGKEKIKELIDRTGGPVVG